MNKCFKIFLLLTVTSQYYKSFAKNDSIQNLSIVQIDSICHTIDNNKNLSEGISEGGFMNDKGVIIEGGWETYFFTDEIRKLYRIKNNVSKDTYTTTNAYFLDKSVVKVILTIEDFHYKPQKEIYSVTYYFNNNEPIKIIGEDIKYSNSKDVLKRVLDIQDDFYNDK